MWILLSLGTALFAGTSDALSKRALETERALTVSWVRAGWGALFLLPFLLISAAPSDPGVFWRSIAYAMPLEILASLALQTALKASPISICIPFLAFTPVFLMIDGWIFLGEKISALAFAGVLFVTAGAFVLHARGAATEERSSRKGPLLVLLVAFLYSVTSVLAKRALIASSPFRFCGTYYLTLAVCLAPFKLTRPRDVLNRPKIFAAIGIAEAAAFFFQFHAFLLVPIAYAIAVKRLSLLVSVVLGRVLFREKNFSTRVAGAALMVAGASLLAFA